MTNEAAKVKREYHQQYRKKNRERLNEYKRRWRAEHPEKTRQYNQSYWERKAECI